jgi:hypothetical protein
VLVAAVARAELDLALGRAGATTRCSQGRGEQSSLRVLVWHWFYNDLDINAFIGKRRLACMTHRSKHNQNNDVCRSSFFDVGRGQARRELYVNALLLQRVL